MAYKRWRKGVVRCSAGNRRYEVLASSQAPRDEVIARCNWRSFVIRAGSVYGGMSASSAGAASRAEGLWLSCVHPVRARSAPNALSVTSRFQVQAWRRSYAAVVPFKLPARNASTAGSIWTRPPQAPDQRECRRVSVSPATLSRAADCGRALESVWAVRKDKQDHGGSFGGGKCFVKHVQSGKAALTPGKGR